MATNDDGPNFDVWYCEAINKGRVASTPGGDALDLEEMRELRATVNAVIARMETDAEQGEGE